MALSTILVKVVGLILLLWTIRSIYKHVKEHRAEARRNEGTTQSLSEQLLNNLLLYVWLLFMVVFSVGMMVNN